VVELAPLAITVPFLAAALLIAALPFSRARADLLAVAVAGGAMVLCALLTIDTVDAGEPLVGFLGGWEPRDGSVALGIAIAIDPLGAGLATLAALLVAVALLFTWRFFDVPGRLFHALMLVFCGGLIGFALTGDLFDMFVFFEVMSVSAYALTAHRIERSSSLQGALGFAVTGSVGAIMILFGIALIYGRTGALNMAQVGEALAGREADGLVVVAFALICGGFLVKAAAVPFHFWLTDAYAVAPTPAAIVFTGVMSDLGVYAVARIYWTVFEGALAPHTEELRAVLVGFAVVTALLGGIMCLFQEHLKRLLAFATISQVGVALIGVGLLTPDGLAGAALLVPADGLLRAGLFVCVGILLHRCGSVRELRLRGRGADVPRLVGVLFVAAALGLAALPPLGAFAGKSLLEEAAREVGYGWLIPVSLIASALTCAALLRAAGRIFGGLGADAVSEPDAQDEAPEALTERQRTPLVMLACATFLVVGGLLLGVVPGVLDTVHDAAAQFTDRPLYAAAVLRDADVRVAETTAAPSIGGVEVILAAVGAIAAVALAFVLLRRRSPFEWRIDSPSVWERSLVRLRRLHSGQIGDYVTWAMVGFAFLGGALAVAV
jgi:multicomponent Na+:H+ antiporter subunit D